MKKRIVSVFKALSGALLFTWGMLAPVMGNAQIATIGNGTIAITLTNPVSVGGFHPINPALAPKNTHIQLVYTKAEINAAGITAAGMIDSIAWDVSEIPATPLKNYTIKGKLYGADNLTEFTSNNLATLFTKPTFQPALGWAWMAFQTPLYWNGVDNIVFDICSDTVTAAISGKLRLSSPATGPNSWAIATNILPQCGVYTGASVSRLKPNIKMSFRAPVICTGIPASMNIIPAGSIQGCSGASITLELGSIPAGSFAVQWEESVNGSPFASVSTNGNGVFYNALIVNGQSNQYRAKITCPSTTTPSITSNVVTINAAPDPHYAALPYYQDFENWMNHCTTLDIPDSSWLNEKVTGPFSWRRQDQGASGGWTTDVNPLYYYPVKSTGNYSARVQTSKGPGSGALMLHLDCSNTSGDKELRFDYFNKTGSNNPLSVYVSKDGGLTYDSLTSYGNQGVGSSAWVEQILPIPSDSVHTVIKFMARSAASQSGDFDMGIDNVRVYPACEGTPNAGIVDSASACLGSGVYLSLQGATLASGLHYNWQESTNGISWNDIAGGNIEHPTPALNGPTWYRCIVTCSNSGLSDTSAPRLVNVSPFYYCYCNSVATTSSKGINLGNVQIRREPTGDTLLNNGNPLPATSNLDANKGYTNYTNITPTELYADSTYKLFLTFMTANGTNVNPQMGAAVIKAWIDYDHSGTFDAGEQIMGHLKAASIYVDSSIYSIPSTALAGITGMRIVTNASSNFDTTLTTPCGSFSKGETEDYLVHIYNLPCVATPNVGNNVAASDSLMCPGYLITLTNPDYDTTIGQLNRIWQSSTDGTNFTDIAGSENRASLTTLFTNNNSVWYRMKATCELSSNAGYSNVVKVNKYIVCYCPSYANGGFSGMADSSDVGGFTFNTINFPLNGGHLNNPEAVESYTNRSSFAPVQLWVDSTYNFSIDHILLRNDHANAKITMFIDYNANGVYDAPQELVYSSITDLTSWQKQGTITIPDNAVVSKPTGLRVIINNNVNPNPESDEACGTYISGETEDYVVMFRDTISNITGVAGLVESIQIYPNPTNGVARLLYKGGTLDNGSIVVQTVTGIKVEEIPFTKLKSGDEIKLYLNNYSKGVYIINLRAKEGKAVGKIVLQ